MTNAIEFENVSKRYRLGTGRTSLREMISGGIGRLFDRNDHNKNNDEFWAVRNLSFGVKNGEVLGFIGSNGSGKTTTLKLISNVAKPTEGRVNINGRVSALIELGAGFHPDLTGRENIYLNGSILGIGLQEIARRFDYIVDFAELWKFIDTPVKRYSSGMYARLGFAVAAHASPDILLVDEVLAVGDVNFQRKCYDFIHEFVNSGKTAVFVSHNMFVIEQLCNRVIWLNNGQVALYGTPGEVLPAYLDYMDKKALEINTTQDNEIDNKGVLTIDKVNLLNCEGKEKDTFKFGQDIIIEVEYNAIEPIQTPYFVIGITGPQGGSSLFLASMLVDGKTPSVIQGKGMLRCKFRGVPLTPKTYHVWGEVWGSDRAEKLVMWKRLRSFRVEDGFERINDDIGKGGLRHLRAGPPFYVPYEWDY